MKTTTDSTYGGLAINTDKAKGQACFTKVLDRYHAHLNDTTDRHSKVMQLRFDLHYPQDGSVEPSPQHLQDFNYNFKRKLDREKCSGGHKVDPRLIMVSEQQDSQHPHIHGLLLVNANAKKSAYSLLQEIEKQWGQAIASDSAGLVDYCNKQGKNGIVMERNKPDFEEKKNDCSRQGSYLAKTRSKEGKVKGSWLVKGTRPPK